MRVFHTLAGRNVGGIEFRVLEQTEWLIRRGHFAVIGAHPDGEVAALAQHRKLPFVPIDFDRPYSPRMIFNLRRTLQQLKIDVIDCHGRRDSKTAALCQDLCTVVRTRHFSQNTKSSIRRRWEWSKGCGWVIATCEAAAASLVASNLVSHKRVNVIGEWASDAFFSKADDPTVRQKMRHHFGLAANVFVVATIGMLRPDKCQEDLLYTVARLHRLGIPAVALIIGSATKQTGAYALHLQQLSHQLGLKQHAIFAGFRADVSEVIQAADAILVPSLIEAWSRVVPEAYAARRPVVASRVGGLPELVRPNVTGWLAEPRDIDGYANQLGEIWLRQRKTEAIVASARQYADCFLHFDAKMGETLNIYEAAIQLTVNASRTQLQMLRGLLRQLKQ